ncbi:DUF2946 family protein [Noviherbaspirillum cavernae]|uniref:DUF2946 family protein n=1 Tax=Noviherbaspirillum cavernae TaxID=2320862 RepID=A0A418WYH1_9BURK|nr:DUF2946 family protein [Noviherbaspirillum cavernae]RJG05212.1 DUF2946 family protein [Noviherbaspirillum cavernae]
MDDIVRQAMAKWPNVPHCYGWLALDARGGWRMRDERAQALHLPGDRINNAALQGFINRNYTHDDAGRWYFQNGPQRVYINLEATPYIAHTDPVHGFVLHTGEPLAEIEIAWMTEEGQLLLQAGEKIALVDDRDMAQCIARLRIDGKPADDERLLEWLDRPDDAASPTLDHNDRKLPLQRIAHSSIAAHFGFRQTPHADGD